MKTEAKLIRALGLGSVIMYGVGDILGAGIYALIGKIAAHAGPYTWLSFAIAMGIAIFTALCYSELGSRIPKSGGVSIYIQEAFDHKWLSMLVGLLLFAATIFSMSTLTQAFVGYLNTFGFNIPNWLGIFCFLGLLLLINMRGISQSSFANIICTLVEMSGLFIVLACGCWYLFYVGKPAIVTSAEKMPGIYDIFQGASLAFFAFTGFEDLANIAEEMKNPEKNLPRAVLFSLLIAGLIYFAVSWVATAILSSAALSASHAPLLEVVQKAFPPMPIYIFSFIAIFAVANTTLLNYITASRLLYGMSHSKLVPRFFQVIHKNYHTPYNAILFIFPIVFVLGMVGTLKDLASSTSAIVLTIFSFSSLALIKIKLKEGRKNAPKNVFIVPFFVPCCAIVLNITAIAFLPLDSIIRAAAFIVLCVVLSWFTERQ